MVVAVAVFVGMIVAFGPRSGTVNTNTGQALVGPKANSPIDFAVLYTIFISGIAGGVLGVVSLFRRERGLLVWLAILFGLAALSVFVGGFFTQT